jgi:hypothetical protein
MARSKAAMACPRGRSWPSNISICSLAGPTMASSVVNATIVGIARSRASTRSMRRALCA